jgi:hypothetical protein
MSSSYQKALDAGYSEQEINTYLTKKDPRYQKAIEAGYKPNEIEEFLKKAPSEKKGIELAPGQRQIGQYGARAIETGLGAPRQMGEFLESLVPEKLIKKGAEKVGLKKPVEKAIEFTKEHAPYKLLPKKEDIREFGKTLFGKTFEPESEMEKVGGDVVEDFTSLAMPVFGGNFKIFKPFLASLGGNLAKETATHFGKSEETGNKIKLGTMLLISLADPKGAEKLKNEMYSKARNARPERVKVDTPNLTKSINNIERLLHQGGSEPWKIKITTKINELRKQMSGNNIEVGELEKFKTSLNNILSELYAEKNVSSTGIKSAQRYANMLGESVDEALKEYGKINPEWEKFYRPANESHGAIVQSQKWGNYIARHAKKFATPGLASLFGITHFAGAGAAALTAGVGYGGFKAGELMVRIAKSPHLRKLYFDTLKDAMQRNIKGMNENLSKLDISLQK